MNQISADKSFELHLSQESKPISPKSDITRQQLAYELNKNIQSTVYSELLEMSQKEMDRSQLK